MMRPLSAPPLLLIVAAAAASLLGCAEGTVAVDSALVAQYRQALLLADEPADAQTPLDWLEATEAPEEEDAPAEEGGEPAEPPASSSDALVLVGQIGGMPNPWPDAEKSFPWRAGEATFFLVDPSTAAEFETHLEEKGDDHAANCPFCAREAAMKASAIAAVSFVDEAGKPIAIGVQDLLGVEAGDMVVVRGKPRTTSGAMLVVDADGLYVRE